MKSTHWHIFCTCRDHTSLERNPSRRRTMDGREILTRMALILRLMDRLADLEAHDQDDAHQLRQERTRLRGKWEELAQQFRYLQVQSHQANVSPTLRAGEHADGNPSLASG